MKRSIILGMGIFVFVSFVVGLSGANAQCVDSLIVRDAQGATGVSGIPVSVIGNNCRGLAGITLSIGFDSSKVVADSVTEGDDLPPGLWGPTVSDTFVTVLWMRTNPADSIPIRINELVKIWFTVKGSGLDFTLICPKDGFGSPPLINTFTDVRADDYYPEFDCGTFDILQPAGAIAGTVLNTETSDAIEGVIIKTYRGGLSDTTDINGNFCIELLTGTYDVMALKKHEYEPDTSFGVNVEASETTIVDFSLSPLCDSLIVGYMWGPPGATERPVSVAAKNCEDLAGYMVCLKYDYEPLVADSVTKDIGTPDGLFRYEIYPDSGWVIVGWMRTDFGVVLPEGTNKLFKVWYSVKDEAVEGDTAFVDLVDGIGDPPMDNSFVDLDASDIYPVLIDTFFYVHVEQIRDGNPLPTFYLLYQNYPNPFNPRTEIEYALPKRNRVKIEIYNISGQKVATLVDEEQDAGRYRTYWNGEISQNVNAAVTSGIYFYRIEAGNYCETKKMVLLR